MNEILLRTIQL